jgi:hypothetical protein
MKGAIAKALVRCMSVNFVNLSTRSIAVRVEHLGATDWASVTFSGAQHRVRVTFDGAGAAGAAADFLGVMGDVELPLSGHIVADLSLRAEARTDSGDHAWLELDILTVEDQEVLASGA